MTTTEQVLFGMVCFVAGLAVPAFHGLASLAYQGLRAWCVDRWSDWRWEREMEWTQQAAAIERERVCREIESWVERQRTTSVVAHMFAPTATDAIRHIRVLTWENYPAARHLDAIQHTHEEEEVTT